MLLGTHLIDGLAIAYHKLGFVDRGLGLTDFVNKIVAIQTHVCLGIVTQVDMVMVCL